MKIISGGQTGADRGGLDAARDLGLPWGGWAPKDWRAEDGAVPEKYRAEMREAGRRAYEFRTKLNVRDSDGTLIVSLGRVLTGGSLMTWNLCDSVGRPRMHLLLQSAAPPTLRGVLLDWFGRHRIHTLNVAGPRESKEPGLQDATRRVLTSILRGVVLP